MAADSRILSGDLTGLAGLRERVKATVAVWRKRIAYRRELAELTFRDIQDIGLDQALIEQEIAKPFWRE